MIVLRRIYSKRSHIQLRDALLVIGLSGICSVLLDSDHVLGWWLYKSFEYEGTWRLFHPLIGLLSIGIIWFGISSIRRLCAKVVLNNKEK